MKAIVNIIAYNEERFIDRCIQQFRNIEEIYDIVVLLSTKPWHGKDHEPDRTEELATVGGATVIKDAWPNEVAQRNYGQWHAISQGVDWVLVVDADEFYNQRDIHSLLKFLETAKGDAYGINSILTYWKSRDYRVDPPENGGLIVAVRPTVKFIDKRGIEGGFEFLPKDIVMHHFSYARTDEEMQKKLGSFEHHHEIVPGWYENIWLKWDVSPKIENLHPVHPETYKRIRYDPAPGGVGI